MEPDVYLLFQKLLEGKCSPQEVDALLQAIETSEGQALLRQLIDRQLHQPVILNEQAEAVRARLDQRLDKILAKPGAVTRLRPWYRYAVAASIILCLGAGGYFLLHKAQPVQLAQNQVIVPGGNKAILTLANGQKISLTDARNGQIARQAGAQISKTNNSQLVYVNSVPGTAASGGTAETVYNTIETPRGGQYTLKLADGTIAILDAASSIKYPVAFNGKERQVAITGQVYFEVVHNAAQPFKVVTARETIEDIGTKFNVNAYENEPALKTTLLEGSIKVNHTLLKPGQQAILKPGSNQLSVAEANTEEVMAWKNGYFIFNDEDIQSIMRKVARWYDVEVTYQGDLSGKTFAGYVSRFKNVSEVLRKLQATGTIHFKTEGRRITVMP